MRAAHITKWSPNISVHSWLAPTPQPRQRSSWRRADICSPPSGGRAPGPRRPRRTGGTRRGRRSLWGASRSLSLVSRRTFWVTHYRHQQSKSGWLKMSSLLYSNLTLNHQLYLHIYLIFIAVQTILRLYSLNIKCCYVRIFIQVEPQNILSRLSVNVGNKQLKMSEIGNC